MKLFFSYLIISLASFLLSCSTIRPTSDKIVTGIHEDATLDCSYKIEFVEGIPKSCVYLKSSEIHQKVGECSDCQEISPENYSKYDIPQDALSACGGWWAGNSDYYYLYCSEGTIELYVASFLSQEDKIKSIPWKLLQTWEI